MRFDNHVAKVVERIGERLDERDAAFEKRIGELVDQRIAAKIEELSPPPPPYGITGGLCTKSGLYRVQDSLTWLVERTFGEGDVFPVAEDGGRERKVTWVYQVPTGGVREG